MDEEVADTTAAEDKVSNHSSSDKEALQMSLDRFSSDQRAERELRSHEFQTLMGLLRLAAGTAGASALPLVRNTPNFTKYDGKCDHSVVNQFIHQFVAHFPLAKITDPQDKIHLAAPHLTGEAVPWWQHWSQLYRDSSAKMPQYDWDMFVANFK